MMVFPRTIAETRLRPDDAPHRQIGNHKAREALIGFWNRPIDDGAPFWHVSCCDESGDETGIRMGRLPSTSGLRATVW